MKKKLLMLLAGVGTFVVLVPASASAQTLVAGKITNNGSGVSGANVTAICNAHSKDTTTNGNGDYGIEFTDAQCPDGAKANVTASKNGMGGTASGEVGDVGATLNIAIVNINIPEFGVIAGLIGTVGAVGLFLVMRRRQSAQAEQRI